MLAQMPTVRSGAGWRAVSATWNNGAISYVFRWEGSIRTDGYRQFSLEFSLPGNGTKSAAALPKQLQFTFVSAQIDGAGSASATAN